MCAPNPLRFLPGSTMKLCFLITLADLCHFRTGLKNLPRLIFDSLTHFLFHGDCIGKTMASGAGKSSGPWGTLRGGLTQKANQECPHWILPEQSSIVHCARLLRFVIVCYIVVILFSHTCPVLPPQDDVSTFPLQLPSFVSLHPSILRITEHTLVHSTHVYRIYELRFWGTE